MLSVAWGTVLLGLAAAPLEVQAQNSPRRGGAVIEEHRHTPVVIDARPIISRLDVPLERPRRILLDSDQNVYVADWGTGAVLKVSPDGEVRMVLDRLNQPSGLALDRMGNLYISTYAQGMTGEGTVVKVPVMGDAAVIVSGLSGPIDVALDAEDRLYVACFDRDLVLKISPDDGMSIVVAEVAHPTALAFDRDGRLYVCSASTGAVARIAADGESAIVARGLTEPSDLAFDADGHLIAANLGATELTYIDAEGRLTPFALVPKGTIAAAFTREGNIYLANWDFHLLLKVTSHLTVPCPHCGKPIPIHLKPSESSESKRPML
jgi:sugar lactone lactonase YvrE